ncbi:MAG: MoaD family protein [Candidatus Methanosuratus sp.]|nr:MoaD family protein [Candidatus Methanosuratincola sp.]
MRVKAEFFADLREKVGCPVKEVDFPGRTVLDLVAEIDALSGGGFMRHIVEGGRLKDLVKVLVNGRDIRGISGLYTELKEGDVVSFFPPVAGG